MFRRLLLIAFAICFFGGLIAYSRYRPVPNTVSGFIEADEIRVGSRVGGRVKSVHVDEGHTVKQGDILLELEPYDLLQREQEAEQSLAALDADYRRLSAGFRPEEIAQAKARYDQRKARYDLLHDGPRSQEIEAARGRLRMAEAQLKFARQKYQRSLDLLQKNAATQADLDAANEQLDASQAQLVVRKEELKLLELGTREEELREARARVDEAQEAWELAKKGYRQEELDQAQAARNAAEAALNVIREQKKELVVHSPLDGVVDALDLRAGDLVPAGAPVLSILDTRHMWVRTYVPQNRVGLQVGQRLRVRADSLGDQPLTGKITFISQQAEFTPNNVQTPEERIKQVFRMKVTLTDQLENLRPGMTVDVSLEPLDESK